MLRHNLHEIRLPALAIGRVDRRDACSGNGHMVDYYHIREDIVVLLFPLRPWSLVLEADIDQAFDSLGVGLWSI